VERFPFVWIAIVLLIGFWLITAYDSGGWPFTR
jgi:hypothetical protein